MCSHSASVETDLSFTHSDSHSTSQHTRNFVYTNLIKQQIQLFCCSVSVVCSFFLSYKFRQDNQFVQHTHTLSLNLSMSLTEFI